MGENDSIKAGEFGRYTRSLEGTIRDGFKEVNRTLSDHGGRISSLETKYEIRRSADRKQTKRSASGWATLIAGGLVTAVEIFHKIGWLK